MVDRRLFFCEEGDLITPRYLSSISSHLRVNMITYYYYRVKKYLAGDRIALHFLSQLDFFGNIKFIQVRLDLFYSFRSSKNGIFFSSFRSIRFTIIWWHYTSQVKGKPSRFSRNAKVVMSFTRIITTSADQKE